MLTQTLLVNQNEEYTIHEASNTGFQGNRVNFMAFCNQSSSDVLNIDLHIVKRGDVVSKTNKLVPNHPINPEDTWYWSSTEALELASGDRIVAVPLSASPDASVTVNQRTSV